MADRYDDERRWRRWDEPRSEWEDEYERNRRDFEWRNRPYDRWEGSAYDREASWSSRQGRMRPRYRGDYGWESERYGPEYGSSYDRDFDREREWARGRDWGRGQRAPRGGYGARMGQETGRRSEGNWRDEQDWRSRQDWRRGQDWEREQMQPYGEDRGRYERYPDVEDYDWVEEEEPITTWTYTEFWYVPGPYAGIGPRDYSRSDERIFEEVCERLTQHGQIDASDIEVEVQNGEVTLTGTVGDRREKRLAEDIADSVFGAMDVHNMLRTRERQLGRVEEIRHEPRGLSGTEGQTGMGAASRDQIRQEMEVFGRDGERIGQVKEVRANDFLVDRPMARDVYVPLSASRLSGDRIMLNIRADEVNDQNWETSEILSGEEGDQQRRNM